MKGFVTAKEAAHLIKNGDTVASAGMALMGLCEDVIRSTEAQISGNRRTEKSDPFLWRAPGQ